MDEFGREKEATMVKKGRSENACLRRKGGDSDFSYVERRRGAFG